MFRRFLESVLSSSGRNGSNQKAFVPEDDDDDQRSTDAEKQMGDGAGGGNGGVSSFGALLGAAEKYRPSEHQLPQNDSKATTVGGIRSPPQNRRKLLTRTPKMDELSHGQTTNLETAALNRNEFCTMDESPLYLLQLAAKGKVPELDRRTASDRTGLLVRDRSGRGMLHYAVKSGHLPTLEFVLSQGADINAKDYDGNTALHSAVETSQKVSLGFLLTHDADPTILNHRQMAPIHLAVDLNKKDILQEMLQHDSVDPNLAGENGATPLHYTAWKDHPDCARILLKNGAKICATCDIGLTSMHIAAQNSSSATLEVLIESAEQKGCGARHELLAKMNQEKNTPLHAAISGGNIQIVRMCLKAGAQIDAKQENGSTPVHMASAQGSLEIIRVMFEMQPEKKMICLFSKDSTGLTPLHMAAMLDRTPTVEYLIQQGAEIDSKALDGQTPLLLAAAKSAWSSAVLLVASRADITIRDPDNRNILHLIIRGGGQPSQFESCICKEVIVNLLNEQDQYGCTPLHYASKQGLLTTIDKLLQLGAQLNAKNNKKQSVLHFAARYGRYNTCRRLINSGFGSTIVNEADGSGQTALHAAATNGHVEVVRLLLQSGAGIFKDVNGNNALHLAAMNSYTQTMAVILNVHSHLLDSVNRNKDTCLHLATVAGHSNVVTLLLDMGARILLNKDHLHLLDLGIRHGKKDVCIAIVSHERWKEALDMKSTLYGCPMVGMIQYMPEVCQMILDRCRIPSGPDTKDKDFHYTYDFEYMQVDIELQRKMRKNGIDILPMYALNMMVKYNRVDCLSHPVCSGFLAMKWASYGMWFHMANLLVYFAYICCLTAFIVTYDFCHGQDTTATVSNSTAPNLTNMTDVVVGAIEVGQQERKECQPQPYLSGGQKFLVIVILTFVVLNVIKEVLQMIQQKMKYVRDVNNRIEWTLYISSAIFIGPFLVNSSQQYQWQFAAVAIFLAWYNYLLFFQRFNSTGIYIVMFLEILKTLMRVIVIFYVLFIAFGLSFFVLLNTGPNSAGFSTPLLSVVSTMVMMLGNIDYLEVWVHPLSESELPNAVMAYLLLVLFILLMPILLINLLIGLAVGDIEAIQKNARLKRIAMQVQLHTELEQKLPSRLLKLVDRPFIKVYPNRQITAWHLLKNRVLLREGFSCEIYKDLRNEVDPTTEYNSFIYNELNQQKLRLKQVRSDMKKQYELLRLIVQKMEIHTEADDVEEDAPSPTVAQQSAPEGTTAIGWSSAALRHVIMKQALIVSKWKKSETD